MKRAMRKFPASAKLMATAAAAAAFFAGASAHAAQPQPWEMTFQPPATDMMRQIEWFGNYTMWFVVPITALVLALARLVHLQVPRQRESGSVARPATTR